MKLKIVMLFILLMLISACSAPPAVPKSEESKPMAPSEDGQQAEVPAEEPVKETESPTEEAPAQEPIIFSNKQEAMAEKPNLEVSSELSEDIKQLLAKHETKVQSFGYWHTKTGKGEKAYNVYVKGNKVKRVYPLQQPLAGKSYDTIYFDVLEKTAQAYCVNDRRCGTKGKISDLDYDEYYAKTPLDWMSEITSATKGQSKTLDSRKVVALVTPESVQWINEFYGMVLQVEQDEIKYTFDTMSFNDLTDKDVTP